MPEVTLQDDSMISQGLHHYALLLSLLISMQKTKTRPLSIQSTPNNSNLLGKSKKVRVTGPGVRVIGSSKKVTGNKKILKKMDGDEIQVSCTLHFKGNERYRMIF